MPVWRSTIAALTSNGKPTNDREILAKELQSSPADRATARRADHTHSRRQPEVQDVDEAAHARAEAEDEHHRDQVLIDPQRRWHLGQDHLWSQVDGLDRSVLAGVAVGREFF